MTRLLRTGPLLGLAAAAGMAATPSLAAELPTPTATVERSAGTAVFAWQPGDDIADRHRYRRYRRHRGVSAGDILAGVLVVGTVAAVANAATKNRDRRYRDRDYRYRDADYRDRRTRRSSAEGGLDSAVDMCLREIERDVRVDEVRNVSRTGSGWQVDGVLYNGESFTCRIGNDGRIDDVDFGGSAGLSDATAGTAPLVDNQHSDARYRAAWADVATSQPEIGGNRAAVTSADYANDADLPAEALPAYPGGPIDGDLEPAAGG